MKMKKVVTLLFLMVTLSVRAQLIAVSTDVAMDALMAPSIGAEIVTGNKSSLSVNATFTRNPYGKTLKGWAVQPEYRYYFSGRPIKGWFVGLGGIGGVYDASIRSKVYDGYAVGGGITFGYVLTFKGKRKKDGGFLDRLGIDFHSGFGAIYYRRKEYYINDNFDIDFSVNGIEQANAKGYYLLPTRFGVSVSYVLF